MSGTEPDLSVPVIQLMKGVVYRDTHDKAWQHLLQLQPQVRDYVEVLGLQVVIDEAEGYAYLRQRPADSGDDRQVPRLIPRRSLSFHVSLLLALLRKKLAEFDAQGGDTKLMLTKAQITEMLRVFLPATSNEARLVDQIDAHINKAVELRVPASCQEHGTRLRGPPHPQGLRRRPVARRFRHQARRVRRHAHGRRGRKRRRRMTDREQGSEQASPGFRLARLELRNWGTFNDLVWALRANGRNTLVTGDIGSGKSTLVDAITTLLLPANRISYNKAAGAETRERSLRSYVLGHYKSERNEATGTTAPVALRDATKFSVILGVFTNEGYGETVTIAQVFWMKASDMAGQPDRFFVTADSDLSISPHFSDFGSEMAQLRKRLRAHPGVRIHDGFPEYGKDFRRRLGIESEQAMELFHQTVSMKSVGNLTQFVREHMLEPFDAARATRDIVDHFEDLTRAHEAVLRAQAQLDALTPLLADCDAHDKVAAETTALTAQREALPFYYADHKARLVERQLSNLATERTRLTVQGEQLAERLERLRDREKQLHVERAGHGGDRLAQIEQRISDMDRDQVGPRCPRCDFRGLADEGRLGPGGDRRAFRDSAQPDRCRPRRCPGVDRREPEQANGGGCRQAQAGRGRRRREQGAAQPPGAQEQHPGEGPGTPDEALPRTAADGRVAAVRR